jgi:hypothetical protein
LKARAMLPPDSNYPCIIRPEAKYRGAENQLYRVEIHKSGNASIRVRRAKRPHSSGLAITVPLYFRF